jgi:hypothetical protein
VQVAPTPANADRAPLKHHAHKNGIVYAQYKHNELVAARIEHEACDYPASLTKRAKSIARHHVCDHAAFLLEIGTI